MREDERCADAFYDMSSDDDEDDAGGCFGEVVKEEEKSKSMPSQKSAANLTDLAMDQSVNGSFPFSEKLAKLMGTSLGALRQHVAALGAVDGAVAEKIVMTFAVLAYLECRLQSSKDSWELLAGKGKRFIGKNLPAGTTFAQLFPTYLNMF